MNNVLLFHEIEGSSRSYSISLSKFKNIIDKLKAKNHNVVCFEDFFDCHTKGDKILLTFDDASVDFYGVVFPFIKKNKIPVTLFVPTGLIGKCISRSDGSRYHVMNKKQILELSRCNLVTLCSHSVSHSDLTKQKRGIVEKEIKESKEFIQSEFGVEEVNGFSFPFGKFNSTVMEAAKVHYRYLFTCESGQYKEGMRIVRRIEVNRINSIILFQFYLNKTISPLIPTLSLMKKSIVRLFS